MLSGCDRFPAPTQQHAKPTVIRTGDWGSTVSRFALIKRFLGASTPPASGNEFKERRIKPRTNARPGTRVLVIDDSSTIVAVLSKMLRSAGYEVSAAGDAEQGIALALQAPHPELIFLDIVLPGMSGFEALRVLRREAATRAVPVIMISGNQQATEQFYSFRIGADDFMKKPFPRAEVFARIERLLDDAQVPRRIGATSDADAATTTPAD